MNKLNRFYLSQNISIDNALSMNQILHQIVNQIKEIVDFINNLELRANEYTDEQIRLLNERLQAQLETLEQTLKTYTTDSIDTYNVEIINPQLTEIRNTIDTINRTINARIDDEVGVLNRRISSVESTLNKKIDDTKEYLEELIKKGNQLVYSSISGRKIPIQDTLFEMGNALKQILSYNWNSIEDFKSNEINGYTDINNDFAYKLIEKDTAMPIIFGTEQHNNVDCIKISTFAPIPPHDIIFNGVDITSSVVDSNSIYLPISDIITYSNIISFSYSSGSGNNNYTYYIINKNIDYSKITFNSIKLAMQELNVNWNALSFTGVNTFYELNETEKMYDTTGIKSDYFVDNKYKTIHNNFESDFFKSNIN